MRVKRSQNPAGSARGLGRLVPTTVLLVSTTVLGATAEAQQLPKSGKYAGKYASHQVTEVAQTYELEKGHVFFLGRSQGVFFNDVADGFLDKTEVTCALANDLVDGVTTALHGYCIVTDKDGDKAFLVHQGKGTAPGKIDGTFQWTGGTGKFTGIQGNNTYHVTGIGKNPASSIVWEGEWRLP
jgi:hypothetical protein